MPRRFTSKKTAQSRRTNTEDSDESDDSISNSRVEHTSRSQTRRPPGPKSRTQVNTNSPGNSSRRPGPKSRSQVVSAPRSHQRKQTEPKALREIRRLQHSTELLIPKLPFSRLMREIITECSATVNRITPEAFEAIQSASEIYLTQMFEDAYKCTLHRDRATLMVKDIKLAVILRNMSLN